MNNIPLRKMRKSIKVILLFAISLAFFITACNKENTSKNDEGDMFKSVADIEADLNLNGGEIEKVITNPLVKIDDCDYIVSGIVEFYSTKDDSWLATINFGDGECDEWATKITDDGTFVFSMDDWGNKEKP